MNKTRATLHQSLGAVNQSYQGEKFPCLVSQQLKAEKKKLIESGTLSIGEPCTPYKLTKTVVTNEGNIEIKEVAISGRKIPLIELRNNCYQATRSTCD